MHSSRKSQPGFTTAFSPNWPFSSAAAIRKLCRSASTIVA
jgi:hypothetical protein